MIAQERKWLEIELGTCNYYLEKAEDMHNLDAFNMWYARRENVKRKIKELAQ